MWIIEPDKNKAAQYAELFFSESTISFGNKGMMNISDEKIKRTKTYAFLKKEEFQQFLTAFPQDLIILHERLFNAIIGGSFNQEEWQSICRKENVSEGLKRKYSKINSLEISALNTIFDYKKYISNDKNVSYPLAQIMAINTCTYCNRQYTLTIYGDTEQEKLIRPEFDHWLPQYLYPDLSLSYFNLISSCKFCNSSLKHTKEMEFSKHIHPYVDKNSGFKFRFLPLSNGEYTVDIDTETGDIIYKTKVQNTLNLFKIKEVYNAHAPFELKDLLDLAIANPNDYIDTLTNNIIKDLHVSKRDAYRMLLGIETMEKDYLKRPFSKFKMDIIKQLEEEKVI